jgi:hypothetical protein
MQIALLLLIIAIVIAASEWHDGDPSGGAPA